MKSQEIDLGVYIKIILKYWWLIGSVVSLCTFLAAYYSVSNYVPVYQAATKLIVNTEGRPDPLGQIGAIGGLGGLGGLGGSGGGGSIDLYKEIIRTPIIMDKVVQRYPNLEVSAEHLMNVVGAYALNGTEVMVITATDYSHERAVMIANAVTEVFQAEIPEISGTGDVIILTEAKLRSNPQPINEKQNTYMILGFMASFVMSVGFVILLDSFDTTLKEEADIERHLGIPLLSTIPKLHKREIAKSDRRVKARGDKTYAATKG